MKRFASRLALVTMLLLAASGMVLQTGSVPHLHADGQTALYNEEHDLTLLAGLAGHVIQVDAIPVLAIDAVSAALPPFTPERLAIHFVRSGDSRAPPAA